MIAISAPSVSNDLSLEETIARLQASPLVDGVAEFGSRTASHMGAASDYDLLILVKAIPTRVFQMVTTIAGRLADIVLVEVETADALPSGAELPRPRSFEALFAQKMRTARIWHDASGRLHKVQAWVLGEAEQVRPTGQPSASELYAAWFWQSHGLLHLKRMAGSTDPIHLSAVDMMLTANLSGTWRGYFEIRQIPWEGEKAALRYWAEHDPGYLGKVRQCLALGDRNEKLAAYQELVEDTLVPIGKALQKGNTAAMLVDQNGAVEVQAILKYWRALFD